MSRASQGAGTGRQARLRTVCRKACGFKSLSWHQPPRLDNYIAMFNYSKKNIEKTTLEYTITVPAKEIEVRYESTLSEVAQETEVQGFRKGTAPLDIARTHIAREKVYDRLIRKLLADIYKDILDKEKIKPVLSPQVDLKKAKEGENWEFSLRIALEPEIILDDYKKIMQEAQAELKKDDIWVPSKGEVDQNKEKFLQKVLDELVKRTSIELSSLVVEFEVNQRLTQLLDDVRKVGLTIDGYLQSKNTTQEQLKKQLEDDVKATYKLEYALNHIADKERIIVEEAEINMLIEHIKDEKEKIEAKKNSYVFSAMLRKQKVIDFLSSL